MPSFSCSSSIRAASQSHTLCLKITHNLAHSSPSDVTHNIKGRLPNELDVLWLSDIIVSLTGSLDNQGALAPEISHSALMKHLKSQLKANASQLGLNNVSRPYVDDEDGLSKLTLTPSRSLPYTSRPHANLVSLHLSYIWKTIGRRKDKDNSGDLMEDVNPFSPTLFLPTEALLNRVTIQFLTYHLVGRYPLIFGPWCKRLDMEMQYFPSIGRSITEIMNRSKSSSFLSKCNRLLKVARSRHKSVLQASATAISSCTRDDENSAEEIEDSPSVSVLTDEQVLCEALEQLFRVGVPRRRFKPIAAIVSLPREADDLVQPSQDDATTDAGTDFPFSWLPLPDFAMSPPRSTSIDVQEALPDDTDVFIQEDWPEDDMWSTREDTSLTRGCDFETPSDESLIGDSDSSASITTPSSQASFPAHYHKYEVDSHALGLGPGTVQQEGAFLEGSGKSALFISLSHHAAHDRHHSQSSDQLTVDQDLGTCQAHSEHFEILDSLEGDGLLEVGYEESDSMLFDLDDMVDPVTNTPIANIPFGDACFSSDVTHFTSTPSNSDVADDFCLPFSMLPHMVDEDDVKDATNGFVAVWSL